MFGGNSLVKRAIFIVMGFYILKGNYSAFQI